MSCDWKEASHVNKAFLDPYLLTHFSAATLVITVVCWKVTQIGSDNDQELGLVWGAGRDVEKSLECSLIPATSLLKSRNKSAPQRGLSVSFIRISVIQQDT